MTVANTREARYNYAKGCPCDGETSRGAINVYLGDADMRSIPRKICGIYKITNTLNGKCYIGQSRDIERRRKDHLRNYPDTHNDYLSKAIKKYGPDNFSFEMIEECTPDCLDRLEQEYIERFHSMTPHGYNIESGGCLHKELSDETKRKIGAAHSRAVNQYGLDGRYLNTFPSAQEVARMTGRDGDRSNIQMVCLGKKKTSLGFQWKYADGGFDDIPPIEGYRREKGARVSQYAKNGSYIATYSSRRAASKATGVSEKNIHACLSGSSKTAGGYIWKYEEPCL